MKKILCYRFDQRVGNTDKILLLSLRTIRDANIDILHHMDHSLDGISSPLLFLKDKVEGRNKKKRMHGKARSRELSKEAEGKVQSRELLCVSPGIQYSCGKKIRTAKVQESFGS